MKPEDLRSSRFGSWLVVGPCKIVRGHTMWRCICDCGTKRLVGARGLKYGSSKSCGCQRNRLIGLANATHGQSRSPTHVSWVAMRRRCNNKGAVQYKYYGGKGVRVCKRWRRFEDFLADMGPRPKGKTLDRIDNTGNYTPSNCRWATQSEQTRNQRNSWKIKYNGKCRPAKEWCEILGLDYKRLHYKIKRRGFTLGAVVAEGL